MFDWLTDYRTPIWKQILSVLALSVVFTFTVIFVSVYIDKHYVSHAYCPDGYTKVYLSRHYVNKVGWVYEKPWCIQADKIGISPTYHTGTKE